MSDKRTPAGRKKKAGRPKLGWLDCTENVRNRWVTREGRRRKQKTVMHEPSFERGIVSNIRAAWQWQKKEDSITTHTHNFPCLCFLISPFTENLVA
jgi:hypothetical protein